MKKPMKLSGYEWDLLEERGHIFGLDQCAWYQIFLCQNDEINLERLKQFYRPSDDTNQQSSK